MGVPDGERVAPRYYILNTLIMSAGMFNLFVAFNTTQAFQTSMGHGKDLKRLNHYCLAVLYFFLTFSCLFAPRVVATLGPRVSMVAGAVPYVLVVLTNLKPDYWYSLPTYALLGIGAAILWTGEGVYVGRNAFQLSRTDGRSFESATSYLNGLFFGIFQFTGTAGTVAGSFILILVANDAARVLYLALSVIGCVGVAVLLLVRDVPDAAPEGLLDKEVEEEGQRLDGVDGAALAETAPPEVSVRATLRLLFFSPQMFLIGVSVFYNGLSIGYVFGDFTEFVITPALTSPDETPKYTGFIIAIFYATDAIGSYLCGTVAGWPRFGRRGLVYVALAAQTAHYLLLLAWPIPHRQPGDTVAPWTYIMLVATSILYGIGDAVWESQQPAMLQSYYERDEDRNAAMANLKMIQSFGTAVQFAMGFILQNYFTVKLVYLLAGLILSTLCVIYCDLRVEPLDPHRRKERLLETTEVHSHGPVRE